MKSIALVCACLWTTTAFGQVKLSTVLLTGDPLPAIGANASFADIWSEASPAINKNGRIAVYCHMQGLPPPILDDPERHNSDDGIVSDVSGSFELVMRIGDPEPMLEGMPLGMPNSPNLNDNGDTMFLAGASLNGNSRQDLIVGKPSRLTILAKTTLSGEPPIPGIPINIFGTYSDQMRNMPVFNVNSVTVFLGKLTGFNGRGMFLANRQGLSMLGWTGNELERPAIYMFGSSSHEVAVINSFGDVAYCTRDQQGDSAIQMWSGGIRYLITGVRLPDGPLVRLRGASGVSINDNGTIAFYGHSGLSGPRGIFLAKHGVSTFIVSEDDIVRLAGEGISSSINPASLLLCGNGEISFSATLSGPDLKPGSELVLVKGLPGKFRIVMRTGMQVPDEKTGAVFTSLGFGRCMNSLGDMVVEASISRPSGTVSCFYVITRNGKLLPIVKRGDLIEVRPGDFRPVSGLNRVFYAGGQDGRVRVINDSGQFVFAARLGNFGSGVIIAQLPD